MSTAAGGNRVSEKTGDGHGTDTSRHLRCGAHYLRRAAKIHFAYQLLFAVSCDPIDAYIDYSDACLGPVAGDRFGAADGSDKHVGPAAD